MGSGERGGDNLLSVFDPTRRAPEINAIGGMVLAVALTQPVAAQVLLRRR